MMSRSAQELALSRMTILLTQANEQLDNRPDRSKRYVQLVRKIQQRYRVAMPLALKQQFCPKCESFLVVGKNATKRIKPPLQNITCQACGHTQKMRLVEKETIKGRKKHEKS